MQCCDNAGGRVELTIDGQRYRPRASITIRPTSFEREAEANADGTIFVTTKPMPAEAEFTLSDQCGLTLETLVNACHIDATITLVDMANRTYLFSQASVVGRPELDTESGEISGLKIVSQLARQLT
ncbi:MAG: phage tail tube protein [Hyphomicrobiales bacterium]|nr:phage tail tube protein [Hyphomicrobiales bacterium]